MSDENRKYTEDTEAPMTVEQARQALEEAREAERKAYQNISGAVNLTDRQRGMIELAKLEEIEEPSIAQMDQKCRLILENYYLPHTVKSGATVELDKTFTRFEDPGRDYIEAVITSPSGRKSSVGYNYKPDEDGKNLVIFEKTFQNIVKKPGDPERYVLYASDGVTEQESLFTEELMERVLRGEVVKVGDDYFQKEKNADGEVCEGSTTMIVEDEGRSNVKIIFGNNEQEKYSIAKNGQLMRGTTNDVTTVTLESRKLAPSEAIYDSEEAARAAAQSQLQEGETNLRVDVSMQGTTIAAFNYVPTFMTSIDLTGVIRKVGKSIDGFDPQASDEENLRIQFVKPITDYLVEKGYHVVNISCENMESDVKENVGFMSTIKTYHLLRGTAIVTYVKKQTATVSLKQGFLGRGQNNDTSVIISQLPAGSELLNPQDIDWKSSKAEVAYVTRGNVTGVGSAKTIEESDSKAVENAIQEAQRVIARTLNGGIASGIKEAITAGGAVSTVASPRTRIGDPVVTAGDMQLTRKDAKYAYSGSCDKMSSTVQNKLVSVTSWNGRVFTYVRPTDPIIDKGIPTDENYDKYVNEGDDIDILVFEKTDRGLRRYMEDVLEAQEQSAGSRQLYRKARTALHVAQTLFDKLLDEKFCRMEEEEELRGEEPALEGTGAEEIEKKEIEVEEIEIEEIEREEIEKEELHAEVSQQEEFEEKTFDNIEDIAENPISLESAMNLENPISPENLTSPMNPENLLETVETVEMVAPEVEEKSEARAALEAIFGGDVQSVAENPESLMNLDNPLSPENLTSPMNPENPLEPVEMIEPEVEEKSEARAALEAIFGGEVQPVAENPESLMNLDNPLSPENLENLLNPENPISPVNPLETVETAAPEVEEKSEARAALEAIFGGETQPVAESLMNPENPLSPENLTNSLNPENPVNPLEPVEMVAPEVEEKSEARAALEAIFGGEAQPVVESPLNLENPISPESSMSPENLANPMNPVNPMNPLETVEMVAPEVEEKSEARAALEAIFGGDIQPVTENSESLVNLENPMSPESLMNPENLANPVNPLGMNLGSEAEVDDAWEKLLRGIPKED